MIDEITRGIAKFTEILTAIDDCNKDGFPYRDGTRAKAELQLRETIRRIFGERSPEFQTHRNHKLHIASHAETKQSIELIKSLIESLAQKKLELQGVAPPIASEPDAPPSQPKPQMTLVPPTPATSAPAPKSEPDATLTVPPTPSVTAPTQTHSDPVSPPPPAQTEPSPLSKEPQPAAKPIAPTAVSKETAPADSPVSWPLEPISATQAIAPPPPSEPAAAHPPEPVAAFAPIWPTVAPNKIVTDTAPVSLASPVQPPSPPAAPVNTAWASDTASITRPSFPVEKPAAAPSLREIAPGPITMPSATNSTPSDIDPLDALRKICARFHFVARQLRLRKEYRTTLEVEDDYDLQDLLCALLRFEFDEVGSDEWTPPYTAGSPRTAFLIDKDRTAVIAKKTRSGLTAKELAEQIAADTERYAARAHCTTLFCFIYDPEGRIGSPKRLETDLTSVSDAFTVEVLVAPK